MSRARGFTLIEIMIVVLIIGILAAIALTAYQNQVTQTRRAAAAACLVESAQFMERFYTTSLRYDQTAAAVAVALPNLECSTSQAPFYTFSLNGVTQRTYTVQAVPQGIQASRDTKCATLTLNQAGLKTVSGSGTVGECW